MNSFKLLLVCVFTCMSLSVLAQDTTKHQPAIFTYVEQMPSFPGDMYAYIGQNIRYPELARKNNIEGRVILNFVVNEEGLISDVKVIRGIGGGCEEEAVRVVEGMPKWRPGKQNKKPVSVYFTLPIAFKLDTGNSPASSTSDGK